jgi:hypothetical protein
VRRRQAASSDLRAALIELEQERVARWARHDHNRRSRLDKLLAGQPVDISVWMAVGLLDGMGLDPYDDVRIEADGSVTNLGRGGRATRDVS